MRQARGIVGVQGVQAVHDGDDSAPVLCDLHTCCQHLEQGSPHTTVVVPPDHTQPLAGQEARDLAVALEVGW